MVDAPTPTDDVLADSGNATDSGAAAVDVMKSDTGSAAEDGESAGDDVAGSGDDGAGSAADGGSAAEDGVAVDPDSASSADGGAAQADAGAAEDAVSPDDGGGSDPDGGSAADGGASSDGGASADGGSGADGGSADGGAADGGTQPDAGPQAPKTPTVKVKQDKKTFTCPIIDGQPDKGATLTWRWRVNSGKWADGKPAWAGEAKDCDLLECELEVKTAGGSATSKPASLQLPLGDGCKTGNVCAVGICSDSGGCTTKEQPGSCEDGDNCTLSDSCVGGVCKAGNKEQCVKWYGDDDGDGYGAKALGCLCGTPDKASKVAGDCNDQNKAAYPKANETCDGVDEDCDGATDEAACDGIFPPGTTDYKPEKPTNGDQFDVAATATFDAGPFGKLTLKGNVKKAGKDKPVTWCFAGPATLKGAPFELNNVKLTICKDDKGVITRTFAGDLKLEGESAEVTGTFSTGAASGLVVNAAALKLLAMPAKMVQFQWKTAANDIHVKQGEVVIDYLGQSLIGESGGTFQPGAANADLQITLAKPAGIKTVGGVVNALSQTGQGSRARVGKLLITGLKLGANKPKLSAASPTTWQVNANRVDGAKWQLVLDSKGTVVAPFDGLSLKGKFVENAKTACVSGDTGVKPAGANTNMQVTVCWTNGKGTVTFSTEVNAKPTGKVELKGMLKDGKLCLSAPAGAAVPGSAQTVVRTCFDAKGKTFSPLTFAAKVALPDKSTVDLAGTWDDKASKLCLAGLNKPQASALFPLKGVKILQIRAHSCYADKGFGAVQLAIDFRVGKAGDKASVVLRSVLDFGEAGGLCVSPAKTAKACAAADVAWRKVAVDPGDRFHGRFFWRGGACIDQSAATPKACGSAGKWLSGGPARANTTLAPACKDKGEVACSNPWQAFWNMPIGAPYDLRTAVFGAVTGAVWIHGGKAAMAVRSAVTSKLKDDRATLASSGGAAIAALKKPQVLATLDEKGAWLAEIVGKMDVNLAAQKVAPWNTHAILRGSVGKDRLTFVGVRLPKGCNASKTTCEWPSSEPFKKVIGAGRFEIGGSGGTVDLSVPFNTAKAVPMVMNLVATSNIKLPGNDKTTAEAQVYVIWPRHEQKGTLSSLPEFTFAVPIAKAKMKVGKHEVVFGKGKNKLGKLEARPIVFLASSNGAEAMPIDLDGDKSNGKETTWQVKTGAAVRSTAIIPHFKHLFDDPTATIEFAWYGLSKFYILGKLDLKWTLIKPEYGVPTLKSLVLDDVFVKLEFPGTLRLYAGGHATVETIDRKKKVNVLKGLAQFEMDKTLAMGGTIGLSGLWKNPFWLPNVAIFNVGLSAKFRPGLPTPTAFGYTGQALLLKNKLDGEWPEIKGNKLNSPVGVNPDGTLMDKLPKSVFTFGHTLYFDTVPSKSGFCVLPGVCPKLPPILLRFDIQNLSTDDMVDLTNLLLAGLKTLIDEAKVLRMYDFDKKKFVQTKAPWKPLLDFIPAGKLLGKATLGPLSFGLDRFLLYMHTHNDERFGVDWPFGFKLAADARFKVLAGPDKGKEKKVKLKGDLDVYGATIKGWMSPIQLVPGLKLTGDPFRRYVELKGGQIRVPLGKGNHNWATWEGWVHATEVKAGKDAAVLFDRRDKNGVGARIATDELAAPCEEGAIDLDGNKLDCKTKKGRLVVTFKTNSGSVPAAQRTRIVKTRFGVIHPAVNHHVSVIRDPKTHQVRIYVDGGEPELLDSSHGKDGKFGTKDDLARFGLPDVSANIVMGKNFHHIDDVRLWTAARSQAEIGRRALRLEKGYHIDKTLLARWEADFDRKLDQINKQTVMRNSRLDMGDPWHGRYEGGAKPAIDPANQDLFFQMDWPLANPLHTGWAIRAGVDLKLPKKFLELSGNPDGITFAADLAYTQKAMGGRLYARELTVVPIPKKGGLVLTGDGPDARKNNWDDGLLIEGEFRYPTKLNFEGEVLPFIDATALLAVDWEGKRQPILGSVLRLGCLKKDDKVGAVFSDKPCKLGSGYHIYTKTLLGKKGELGVNLGKGLGKLAIQGIFELSTLDAPVKLNVQGGVKVFGRQLVDVLIKLDKSGFKALAALDLGINHGVNLGLAAKVEITYDWNPARLCASGNTDLKIPVLATFKGKVAACFGTNPMASFEGTAKAGKFGGIPVADLAVKLHTSKGLEITKARLKIPTVFDGNLTGFYKGVSNFDLKGNAKMKPGTGKLFKLDSTTTVKRGQGDKTTLIANTTDVSAVSGWVKATVKGAIKYQKSQWYYALAGTATLKPLGFKMASGRFWLCKTWSKTDKSIPSECKTESGIGASAKLDLGIAKMTVKGGIKTNVKISGKTVDQVYLTGSLKLKVHKVFSVEGTAHMHMTEPFVGGYNQLKLTAKLSALGASTTKSYTLQSGANGLPKPYTMSAAGTLTPFSGFKLASGSALYKWDGSKTLASASGILDLSPVLKGKTSATFATNGSATWKGTGKMNLATLLKADTSWTLGTKGAAFDANFKANTYVLTLGVDIAGTIPKDVKFAFDGKGWMKLYPFPKSTFLSFDVSHDKGFKGEAIADLKVVKMKVAIVAGPKSTGIGVSGSATLSTWKIGTFLFKWIEDVTKKVAKKLKGCSCKACGSCWGGAPGFRCKCKETKSSNSEVKASVTFKLSGTSYEKSSTVKLSATAMLTAGKWSGSSTTSCSIGSKPQCCFKFVSPIGNRCLKLY